MKEVLTTFEVAKLLGISPYTVRLWIINGILKGYKTPGGHRRVKTRDLMNFLKKQKMPLPAFGISSKNICLVLSDNEREIIKLKKLQLPFEFVFTRNPVWCGIAIERLKPQVIFLDFDSKRFFFKDLSQAIDKNFELSQIVLLGFAKNINPDLIIQSERAGFFDILQKPVSQEDLLATFSKIFKKGKYTYRLKRDK